MSLGKGADMVDAEPGGVALVGPEDLRESMVGAINAVNRGALGECALICV